MVNIHKCKKCNEEIYFKPVFASASGFLGHGIGSGYTKSFQAMNLNKTEHNCESERLRNICIGEDEYLERAERAIVESETNYEHRHWSDELQTPRTYNWLFNDEED